MNKGIALSLITVLMWALNDVTTRFVVQTYDAHAVVYTCLYLLVGAFILIIIAGPGEGGLRTLRLPHTWSFGVIEILMHIGQFFALVYITSTEMNFLLRMSVFLSLIMSWMFFARRPSKWDMLGALVILGGILYMLEGIPEGVRVAAFVSVLFVAITVTAKTMIAEAHPESTKDLTIKQRCRVTGYVVLAAAVLFLLFALGGAVVQHVDTSGVASTMPLIASLPTLADFVYLPAILCAIVFGFLVIPANVYFYLYAVAEAKTENFLIIATLTPFVTFFLEWVASLFGLLDIRGITLSDMLAGVVIVLGGLFIVAMRYKKEQQEN